VNRCLFCGGDARSAEHFKHCDGRQGRLEELFQADVPPLITVPDDDDPQTGSIAERAERFHRRNPAVYRFAVDVCRYMRRRRVQHYGIGAVWEIMRFKYLETHGDIYKLNNNYRAFYARLIMSQEPDLAGFFQTRECPNDPDYHTRPVIGAEVERT
jgi:hypothetical protein